MADSGPTPLRVDDVSQGPQKAAFNTLLRAVASSSPVAGLTHRFYRYPARFSPEFAAAAIGAFTGAGDYVLDPFMGGGTTVVEALAAGRRVVGTDINALAGFITRAKITPLTTRDSEAVLAWRESLQFATLLNKPVHRELDWQSYQRNLPWWLRDTLSLAKKSTQTLHNGRQRRFAVMSLLKTAQWALDCRATLPTRAELLDRHRKDLVAMIGGAHAFHQRMLAHSGKPIRYIADQSRLLVRSTAGVHMDPRLPPDWGPPKLILTSPPYVGVHILYHRWQVRGRRETSAPYWLTGQLDGRPNSYYNFADRKQRGMDRYLDAMRASYSSIVALMDKSSVLVQLIAFARPEEQLRPYLDALKELGLRAFELHGYSAHEPISRLVPNRKWYADAKGPNGASNEFLLIHTKS